MKILFSGKTPKDLDYLESIEDNFAISVEKNLITLSDGASESFNSKFWSEILVSLFIENPKVNEAWLNEAMDQYHNKIDIASLSWSKISAFERGSFATLLGLEFNDTLNCIELINIGDSLAVLLDGDNLIHSYRYQKSEEFSLRPELLSTKNVLNDFIKDKDFYKKHYCTWNLKNYTNPILMCMTDALAEWALRMHENGNPKWETLLEITNENELWVLVEEERKVNKMNVDDVTLITVKL